VDYGDRFATVPNRFLHWNRNVRYFACTAGAGLDVLIGDARLAERSLVRAVWSGIRRCERPVRLTPGGSFLFISQAAKESAYPPISDVRADMRALPVSAKSCPEQVQQKSALERLSHSITSSARPGSGRDGKASALAGVGQAVKMKRTSCTFGDVAFVG